MALKEAFGGPFWWQVNALNREIEALDKQNRQLKEQLANQQEIESESGGLSVT